MNEPEAARETPERVAPKHAGAVVAGAEPGGSWSDEGPIPQEWNATRSAFPDWCAHELFEQQVARDPAAIAVTFQGQQLTYGEVNQRANRLAHHLLKRGVGPDALIGISLHRSPMMVVGLLGIWKAGAAYVPLDPTYPAERLNFMADDAAVRCLLTDSASRTLFPSRQDQILCLDTDWPAIAGESDEDPSSGVRPHHLAYVIYTSGSTGAPKGALITHSGLVNYLVWAIAAYGVEAGGSVPVHSSVSFDLTVTSLYPALLAGGRLELLPEDVGAQSLLASLRGPGTHCLVKITPAHLELITQQVGRHEAAATTRAFVIGGENLTAESLRLWREAAPGIRLINEYGPTETVVGCCTYEVRPEDPWNGSVPIGRPIANTELHVLDESLRRVGPGVAGELYIGGAGVARGYLNRPQLTRERFLPDPFSGRPGARLYRTGDLARYRGDGVLEYLGRIDDQVKVRGYRIELGEIEATLAERPEVQSAVVAVREDTPGNKQLVAYCVPRVDHSPVVEELRRFLKQRLPEYMVPARIVLVATIPLTSNGKVDRKALPAPSSEDASRARDYAAPRSDVERWLAQVWSELLHLDRIGIHDDVVDAGASSLMVMGALSRIRTQLGVELEMQVLIENSTIAQMAVAIESQTGPAGAAGGQASAESPPPPAAVPGVAPAIAEQVIAGPRRAEAHVTPIRFGGSGGDLVGMYQPPSGEQDLRECCVLLDPFGQEAVRSHRLFRILADRLARSGFHVLRFDYFGAGDSLGRDDQADLERWVGDVLLASDELVRLSGCPRSVWLGLRLGATLGALAAERVARPLHRLILWEPVIDGPAFLRELAAAHVQGRRKAFAARWARDAAWRSRVQAEVGSEALGYPITARLRSQINAVAPRSFRAVRAERVTTVTSPTLDPRSAELRQHLAASGAELRSVQLGGKITWTENSMLSDSVLAPPDIRSLVEAVAEA